MANVTVAGWFIVGLISLGCWWAVVVRIFERGRALLGAVAFLTLPISYLPLFVFGWARFRELGLEKPLLVWTYCIATAVLLPMAWLAGLLTASMIR